MSICNPLIDKNCQGGNPSGDPDIVANSVSRGEKFIGGAITVLFAIGAIYFIFTLIMAGFSFISSNGDEKQLNAAKGKIMGALMGLLVIFSIYAILTFFGNFLGINLIKLNLPTLT